MDNFSAPRFDLLFRPQEYTPKPNEDANFMGNIAALQDPSGTLARKQAELVAKNMAQVKTDDIRGEFQKFALDEMQRNLDDELGMYKSNKGFNRLSLNADQLLTKQKRDKELVGKVGALRQLSESYEKAMERAATDVYKETITPDDYKAFDESIKKKMREAKGIGDIPDALGEYNLFLAKNPKPYDWAAMNKDVNAMANGATIHKTTNQDGRVIYDIEKRDVTPFVQNAFMANPKFRKYWTDWANGNETDGLRAAVEYASKFNIDNRQYGGVIPEGRESYAEWKRKRDYGDAQDAKKQITYIPMDSDANGRVWRFNSTPKKAKYSGNVNVKGEDGTVGKVYVKNADVNEIHIDDKTGQAYVTIEGTTPGTNGVPVIANIPVNRDMIVHLKTMKIIPEGYTGPFSGDFGETVPYNDGSNAKSNSKSGAIDLTIL